MRRVGSEGKERERKILPNPPLQKEGIKRKGIDFSLGARNDDERERRDVEEEKCTGDVEVGKKSKEHTLCVRRQGNEVFSG
jgi:hypothetical protein